MLKIIKKMWYCCWAIYNKNKELWNYLISGGFGVIISVGSFWICRLINLDIVSSNSISWVIAVIAMYLTNKIFVFKSKCTTFKELAVEFFLFMGARVFTLILETLIIYNFAEKLNINDIITKIIAQIVVIVLNYILSKLIIFKKKSSKIQDS